MSDTLTLPATAPVRAHHHAGLTALTLGALGVVFGDIGTSPLYALQTVFAIGHGAVKPTPPDVYGVVSLVFWSITLIVSMKYVGLILRADNEGEGGIMALTALLQRVRPRAGALVLLGIFGASLFYGDGVITPAISVLSAVEGLKVAAPSLHAFIVPIAVAILAALFAIQRFGTHRVGGLFGPVMLFWFAVIGVAGAAQVAHHPQTLRGLSPTYAVDFWVRDPGVAFVAMGAVVLAITGAEALYADMGHFGASPIRRAWFAIVFPALTLNYLGQAGLILHDPRNASNPFFLMLPGWAQLPMVFLATAATVIASQAVISGAYSVSRQATRLGFLPPLKIRHTSDQEIGQVYVPAVNAVLFVAVLALVVGFGSSASLASAYGIAVSGTFIVNTVLFLGVLRWLWRKPKWLVVLTAIPLLTVESLFLAANLTKLVHGGWLPLAIGIAVFVAMSTWRRGRAIVTANRRAEEGPLPELIEQLRRHPPTRVPGTAVFPHPTCETAPLALRANLEHNGVLHEHVVIISGEPVAVPHVPDAERLRVQQLACIRHVVARYGFMDDPNLPAALRLAGEDAEGASWFISRMMLRPTRAPGLARWRKRLFLALARNAASPVDVFGLPLERTVLTGSPVDL